MFILSIVLDVNRNCLTPLLTWGICNSIISRNLGNKPIILKYDDNGDERYAIAVNQNSTILDRLEGRETNQDDIIIASPNLVVLAQIRNQMGALVVEQIDNRAVMPSFHFLTRIQEGTTEASATHEIGIFENIRSTDSVPLLDGGLVGLHSKSAQAYFILLRGLLANYAFEAGLIEDLDLFDAEFKVAEK